MAIDDRQITTTLDIVFCLDTSSSMISYLNQIRATISSFLCRIPSYGEGNVRLALIEFRADSVSPTTIIHRFTSSVETLREWLDNVQIGGGSADDSKAVVHALADALAMPWRSYADHRRTHEKLVVLFTDGPPCGLMNGDCPCHSEDLWKLLKRFEKRWITIAVVGVEPSVNICSDFYCALAKRTGGEYLPLVNAAPILSEVIDQAMHTEDTLSQLFRGVNMNDLQLDSLYRYSAIENRVKFMMTHCRTIPEIRRQMFNWRERPPSPPGYQTYLSDGHDDDFQPSAPPSTFFWDPSLFASTPETDDEGYRTRLPTTASPNSSFSQRIDSPTLSYSMDSDPFSDIDDVMF